MTSQAASAAIAQMQAFVDEIERVFRVKLTPADVTVRIYTDADTLKRRTRPRRADQRQLKARVPE